jgi:uncharacterized surface protein with fasciclin (FAS1) repeats
MAHPTRMLRAIALAAPLGALALSAQAADIISTIKEQQQFSTLAEAIESAGLAPSLQGEGPYTVFAPTDQAFDRLPQEVRDALMQQENQGQLKSLLEYHVVEGQAMTAEDALGQQTEVDTVSGDRLSVGGTGQMVLLVPEQALQGGQRSAQQGDVQTQVTGESGMPTSEHQQQVLATEPATEQRQTMTGETEMPASPHQEQLLRGEQGAQPSMERQQAAQGSAMPSSPHQEQVLATEPTTGQGQTMTGETGMPSSPHQEQLLRGEQGAQPSMQQPQTAQGSAMPSSPHQEQVLATEPTTGQRQTMTGETGMPSSPHQEQVLQVQQQVQGILRQATVIEPDIRADNGVIHAVDAVLIPQSVLSLLENTATRPGQSEQSRM